MKINQVPYLALAASATLALFPGAMIQASAQSGPYSVTASWSIGGGGGWDYLRADPGMHVLYVSHGTEVAVLDLTSGKVVATIAGLKRAHDIAIDPNAKVGFISDGDANMVVVFDRKTYAKVSTIPTGKNPDGMVFEPLTKTVWAFDGRSNEATVIDVATQKAVATIKVPGKPEYPQADGKGAVFVNIEDKNSIVRLDAKAHQQTAEWPLKGCESPSGLAMDTTHRRLYSVCDGKVMAATDADAGKVLKLIPIGDGPDAARYDPRNQVAFSSNEDGTLTMVNTKNDAFNVIQTVKTKKSGRTMAFDSTTGRAFVVVADFGPRPAPTAANPHPRLPALPGTFKVLVISRK